MPPTPLRWPGLRNVRDLGGLPTVDGGLVRHGAVVRADSPHVLTADGIAALRSGRRR
jgi:protein-tyrosine phosphatase